jgi:hypothetical protein
MLKSQINTNKTKYQITNSLIFGKLKVGAYLIFGFCCLDFSPLKLKSISNL